MQSLMFIFAALPTNGSIPDLTELGKEIENSAKDVGIEIKFDRKDKLLIGRLNDVSYYVSFLEDKKELKDWYTMAKDFELMLERKPISKQALVKRYLGIRESRKNPYLDIHFKVGEIIFEELDKSTDILIYTFQ